MTDSNAHREPSMDEILSTIRRMIVQDGGRPAGGPGGSAPAGTNGVPGKGGGGGGDDLLMLTDAAEGDDDVLVLSMPAAAAAPPPVEAQAIMMPPPTPRAPVYAEPVQTQRTEGRGQQDMDIGPVLGNSTEDLIGAAISRFSSAAAQQRTLEDVAKEALKPLFKDWIDANLSVLLREWMDRNLPPIVERTVERELLRISRSNPKAR